MATLRESITVDDPDGFIAFADAPGYRGFVGPDWLLDQLCDVFDGACADGTLAIAYVEQEASWTLVDFLDAPTTRQARAEHRFELDLPSGLWLTSYTDLSMVAQFEDLTLVDQRETTRLLELEPGRWTLVLRLLLEEAEPGKGITEVVLTPSRGGVTASPFPGRLELGV